MTKPQKAAAKAPRRTAARKTTEGPGVRTVDSILDELAAMRRTITERAYEIFNLNGCRQGRDLEDWLEAEQELTFRPPIELSQSDSSVTLEAAVPGFEPGDLDVQVTPEDILIKSDRTRPVASGATIHRCELSHGKLFRDVRLPAAIDPEKARAEYRNGLLRVTAPVVRKRGSERVRIAPN